MGSTVDGPFYHPGDLEGWVANGGNVGRALNDSLVALDVDDTALADAADELLPPTFTVRTGNGEHRYYDCPGWRDNRQLGAVGSIRSDHYLVVVPPSTHPNGREYAALREQPVVSITPEALGALADTVAPARDTASPSPAACSEDVLSAVRHDQRRAELLSILWDSNAGHRERVWLAGFLNSVVGMSVCEIVDVIERHNRWADFDRATTRRQVESVVRSRGRSR